MGNLDDFLDDLIVYCLDYSIDDSDFDDDEMLCGNS